MSNTYLLLGEFSVRTVNYGPSFLPSIYGPSGKRAGHKSMEKKPGSVINSTDRKNQANKMFIIWLLPVLGDRKQVQDARFDNPLTGVKKESFHWLTKTIAQKRKWKQIFAMLKKFIWTKRKALDNIDLNQMSHRYVSGVLQNEPSTSAHLIDRCENVNFS